MFTLFAQAYLSQYVWQMANLVDLESPILYSKIQSQSFFASGEVDFKEFFTI